MDQTIIQNEKSHIELALTKLRPLFPAGTPDSEILSQVLRNGNGECNPENVAKFAKTKKRFSTADVMQHFQVSKYKVAGSLAALTRAAKIKAEEKQDNNGYTRYEWVG